ncbi:putative bifunctional diguanylate cyclase/phosphodiesterase [Halioxenophilus aromaticivorans]|uniref:putative bifunctional diguanylate cyclase/phosphodiesterase n=1 Tax=Halioxenophilus aromaticivorans TaxID=1306992 RepID=UPI0031EACD47
MDKRVVAISDRYRNVLQEQLEVLSRSAKIGVFRLYCDENGNIDLDNSNNWLVMNPAIVGAPSDATLTITDVLAVFFESDAAAHFNTLNCAIVGGCNYLEKSAHLAKTAQGAIWLTTEINVTRSGDDALYLDGEVRNVSSEKRILKNFSELGEHINTILLELPVAIFRLELTQPDDEINAMPVPGASWMLHGSLLYGQPEGSLKSPMDATKFVHPEDRQLIIDAFENAVKHKLSRYQIEYRTIWPDGSEHWLISKAVFEYDDNNTPLTLSGVQYDITEQKLQQQKLEFMAGHDHLTDLPNRALCMETLARTVAAAHRYNRKFAVMFIDLDRFKIINDTIGHECGDRLLKEIASRFRSNLRASEFISRVGGDEFVVIADGISHIEQAQVVAEKLISLTILPVAIDGVEYRVTASVGVTQYPDDGLDEQTLLKHAEMAMYTAKERGKNNFSVYNREMAALSLEKMDLDTQLRGALERNEFSLLYQPKVGLQRDVITGVEALLRWENQKLGFVSPMRFIPIAEENGLIVPIGRWVMETACRQTKEWQKLGLEVVPVAVNVSPRQFLEPDFYDDVLNALNSSGLDPSLLELELTEGMIMSDIERTVALLTALKDLGVRVAIDDFGTGYSSLAQIRRFPIDTLKVDRSFVRNIHHDTEGQAITSAIFDMAKNLSLTVVAEGVETNDEASYLRSSNCDEMQGYYFSKPVDEKRIAIMLSDHLPRYQ